MLCNAITSTPHVNCWIVKCFRPAAPNLDKRNKKGETQLHQDTIKGNVENVKKLLRDGASPNTVDNAGWSPLHEAVALG